MKVITVLAIFFGFCSANASSPVTISAGKNLNGSWSTTSVRCVNAKGSQAPTYSASVNLNMSEGRYSASGTVASFNCSFSGSYTVAGNTINFKILNDGGCPLGEYLNGRFVGSLNGNRMLVKLGKNIGNALCDEPESQLNVTLSKSSK